MSRAINSLIAFDRRAFVEKVLNITPDARQIKLLESTAKRGLLNCTRQWGKSTMTAAMAVHRAIYQRGSLTLVVSPSARQSGEFVRKSRGMLRAMGTRARGDGDNEISLLLDNGSRIIGLPGVEGTVRGFSAVSLLLIDEAARVPDAMYKAVRPMLAVGDGDLWLMSTPFGARGFFWEEWTQGGPHWERISVPATECPRIPKKFLEEERAALGEWWFRQEYLCEFVDVSTSLFSRDTIMDAFDPGIEPLFK